MNERGSNWKQDVVFMPVDNQEGNYDTWQIGDLIFYCTLSEGEDVLSMQKIAYDNAMRLTKVDIGINSDDEDEDEDIDINENGKFVESDLSLTDFGRKAGIILKYTRKTLILQFKPSYMSLSFLNMKDVLQQISEDAGSDICYIPLKSGYGLMSMKQEEDIAENVEDLRQIYRGLFQYFGEEGLRVTEKFYCYSRKKQKLVVY